MAHATDQSGLLTRIARESVTSSAPMGSLALSNVAICARKSPRSRKRRYESVPSAFFSFRSWHKHHMMRSKP